MHSINEEVRSNILASLNMTPLYYKAANDLAVQYFREGQYGVAQGYLEKTDEGNGKGMLQLDIWAATKELGQLQAALLDAEWIPDDRLYYYQALLAMEQNDNERASQLFDAVSGLNPYREESVIAAGVFFRGQEGLKSYDILVRAVLQSTSSVKLLKAYIDECLHLHFATYAESALLTLRELSLPDYNQYLQRNIVAIDSLLRGEVQ